MPSYLSHYRRDYQEVNQLSMYSLLCCLLMQLSWNTSNAQKENWVISDTSLVYELIDSTYKTRRKDKDAAEQLAIQSIELADKIDEPTARAKARLNLAVLNLNKYKPHSKVILWETVAICESADLPALKASAYNNLGLNYRQEGILDSALYCHKETINWANANNNDDLLWKSKMGLVRVYNAGNQVEEAEKLLKEVWKLVQDGQNRMKKGMTIYHTASFYYQTNRFGEFGKWQEEWQNFVLSGKKSIDEVINPQHAQFSLFFEDFPKSIARLDTILAYHKARKDTMKIGIAYWELAQNLKKEGQYKEALASYALAQPIVEERMGHFFQATFYQMQYKAAKEADDIPTALASFENLQNLLTKVRQSEMDKRIAELEIKYETAEKETEIAKAQQDKNLMILGLVLLGLLAAVIIWSLRNRLKIKEKLVQQATQLQQQRIHQLEQEKQLTAYNFILEGQEQERARIAKELHDGLGGLLATIKAHFTTFESEKKPQLYQKTNQLLDTACKEIRTISHNMMPHSLMLSGLTGGLEDLATSLETENIKCDFETLGWSDTLILPNQQVMLYRIIQELIQNIRKHADAKQVLIQLMRHQNELTLIVEDDGKGFSPQQQSAGIGLKNIQSRVKFLKGMIDIDTVEGEGTTTTIRIPINFQKNGKSKKEETAII